MANPVEIATKDAATLSTVASAATSAQALGSNPSRRGVIAVNTDANSCYLKYGATATTTSFSYIIGPNVTWEMPNPVYTGRIDVIWSADGSGSLFITEM
jgi:hypothetical protein